MIFSLTLFHECFVAILIKSLMYDTQNAENFKQLLIHKTDLHDNFFINKYYCHGCL